LDHRRCTDVITQIYIIERIIDTKQEKRRSIITFPSSFVVVVVVDPFVEDPYTAEFDMVDCDETVLGMSFGYPWDGRYYKD
jgi:hypothetical protein